MRLSIVEVHPGPQEARGEWGQIGLTVFKVLVFIDIQGHSTHGTRRTIHWLKNLTVYFIHKAQVNIFTLFAQKFEWLGVQFKRKFHAKGPPRHKNFQQVKN